MRQPLSLIFQKYTSAFLQENFNSNLFQHMDSAALKLSKLSSFTLIAILFTSLAIKVQGQSTPFEVKPTGYTISVDGNTADFEVYTIHNSPYCQVHDLARAMQGVFEVQSRIAKNSDGTEYPEFWITPGMEQKGSSAKPYSKNHLAQSTYAHLFVNNLRRPTTPYKVNNGYYFKMADILRVLDKQLVVDHTKRTIEISTRKPFVMPLPKAPKENPLPKKWTRVPAHVGAAVASLNGYFDVHSSSVIFNHQVEDHLFANALVIVHIPTGRRIELPFEEKENSYGGVYRGFSDGWMPVIAKIGEERLFTYVNAVGEVINPKMLFTTARAFENGYAFVTYSENGADYSGVIDLRGELVVAVVGKYENAQFGNGVFGFQSLLKMNHNAFYDVHYFGIDGKRINMPLERAKELESPGYLTAEVEKFEPHRAKYSKSHYCGYNRFMVEVNGKVKVVDSDNKTVFESDLGMHFIKPLFAWGKLFFRSRGIQDHNGNQILENKYDVIDPVEGEAFLTIIDNKEQALIGLDGKVLATSSNPSLWALDKGVLITQKNYLFSRQVLPGDVVMIYSNMDLDSTLPTDNLKNLVSTRPHTWNHFSPIHTEAQRIVKNPRTNALHVIALEALYKNWFSTQRIGE